ncbi:hypothetical protein [Ferruginibacter sp. SUN106]|uniref:hypothetical protein n=1 Tax=Ferruginibacter sp. SUN106 TaxID=2978348 RepID=UPI003D36815D
MLIKDQIKRFYSLLKSANLLDWRNELQIRKEKKAIGHAFPSSLRQDVECVINILPFNRHIKHQDGNEIKVNSLIHQGKLVVSLNKEILKIPERIYFNIPPEDKEKELTDLQKDILNCLYLKHHNGFVRQKRLKLLSGKNDDFVVAFKFDLLGDYVIEIVEDLQKHITRDSIDSFVKFATENEKYFSRTESRMTSFWSAHYRWKFEKLKYYIGKQNIDEIKKRIAELHKQKQDAISNAL